MTRTLPLARWLLSTSVLAVVLILCAGRADNPIITAYLAVYAGMGLATALATESPLDGERRKPGPAAIDPGSRLVASALFLTTVMIAALDADRLHWVQAVNGRIQIAALAVLILAGGLEIWAMAVNPFFSTVIRIQADRGHELVTRGPYRFIRHPGYLAMIIIMPATAIALGSIIALAPALCYSALVVWRTRKEDRFLADSFDGYAWYIQNVRYRLVPILW